MEVTKYYCDLCHNETPMSEFKTVKIDIKDGYDVSHERAKGGQESLCVCHFCMDEMGYNLNASGQKWCDGVKKFFLGLVSRHNIFSSQNSLQ